MKTSAFDYELPETLIAAHPAERRDGARLLVVGEELRDAQVDELPAASPLEVNKPWLLMTMIIQNKTKHNNYNNR